jgi:hypothetical protein
MTHIMTFEDRKIDEHLDEIWYIIRKYVT